MHHHIACAIGAGSSALYEYDMGDTTRLTVRVHKAPAAAAAWYREQDPKPPGATVMQNLMPERCRGCGGEAAFVNSEGYVCAADKRRRYGQPLFNSPPRRGGMLRRGNGAGPGGATHGVGNQARGYLTGEPRDREPGLRGGVF